MLCVLLLWTWPMCRSRNILHIYPGVSKKQSLQKGQNETFWHLWILFLTIPSMFLYRIVYKTSHKHITTGFGFHDQPLIFLNMFSQVWGSTTPFLLLVSSPFILAISPSEIMIRKHTIQRSEGTIEGPKLQWEYVKVTSRRTTSQIVWTEDKE